ncbi:MAG: hypothetical protein ACHQ1H_14520 [Nitrososphaerales archaeon]
MAIWLVKARPRKEKLGDLRKRLDSGEIESMRPFGIGLDGGLRNARYNSKDKFAYWEEEDYCHPPLAQEREAILDEYFDELSVLEDVKIRGRAWKQIEELPLIWVTP